MIKDHKYCDHAIGTAADENKALRVNYLSCERRFLELAARHADLKAQHKLYPFYVQKPVGQRLPYSRVIGERMGIRQSLALERGGNISKTLVESLTR